MTPSFEEIDAGRKAYRRLRTVGRFYSVKNWMAFKVCVGAFIIYCGWIAYRDFTDRGADYHQVVRLLVCFFYLLHWRNQKITLCEDREILRQIKSKYGEGIFREIVREPSSIWYLLFRKIYPPCSWRVLRHLP